jgi:hypothetical protein
LDIIEQHQLFRLHTFEKYSGPRHEIGMVASDHHNLIRRAQSVKE